MIQIWRSHFLAIEGAVIVLAGFVFTWLAQSDDFPNSFFSDNVTDAIAVLAALAGTFGTLLGFTIAVAVFLFSVIENPAFAVLRTSKSYATLWAIFKGAVYACFVATAASISGLCAAWCSLLSKWHEILIILSATWALFRLARVVWVIKQMIDAEVRRGASLRNEKALA